MTDTATRAGGPTPPNPNTFKGATAVADTPPGTPLFASATVDNEHGLARANAAGTTYVSGLASAQAEAGGPVPVQYAGPLTLTTAEWDLICGTDGGLNQGVPYYLSTATAGKLSANAGSGAGNFVAPVGVAHSATTMMISILPVPLVISE